MQLDQHVLSELREVIGNNPVAFDFETWGVNYMAPDFGIRCVSFHNDEISISVEVRTSRDAAYLPFSFELFEWMTTLKVVAHNAGFDVGALEAMTGVWNEPFACTYALLASLANEGSPGQSWGLKQAGPELLTCEAWDKDVKGDKANMSDLPWETIGWYNQQDSWATWELLKSCRIAVEEHYDTWGRHFWQFHQEDMMNLVTLQGEAYREGLYVDVPYIKTYQATVEDEIAAALDRSYNHPDLQPHIEAFNDNVVQIAESEARNYPSKIKKDGEITINYQKKLDQLVEIRAAQHFNIGSPGHLKWLFYDRLKVDVKFYTDGGQPAMDADALEGIPIYGKLVINYRDADNKQRFLNALRDNSVNGVVRVSVKTPGTITGRCSAGALEGT